MVTGWARGAAIYESTVRHTRMRQAEYRLRHRTFYWYVDLDDPPRPPFWLRPLARFRDDDHVTDPGASLRESVAAFARDEGVESDGCRVTMLAHARVLGHVFNPLTVYWLRHPDDGLRCVVAEVHNTYGGRHRYLLRPDERGRGSADKDFYVSPFLPVAGEYRMSLPEPGARLAISVTLRIDGEPAMVATVDGRARPAGTAALLKASLSHPFSTVAVAAAIRWHGVRLRLKGLPVVSGDRREHRKEPHGSSG